MGLTSIIFAIINIVAIILTPIFAVLIGQYLQNKTRKREDKKQIFAVLMSNRHYGWTSRDSVYALNIISIVFSDSANVIEKWALYYEYMGRPKESVSSHTSDIKRTELLEAIAEELGYKGKITWKTIQESYMPTGYSNHLYNEVQIQEGMAKLLKFFNEVVNKIPVESMHAREIIKGIVIDFGRVITELAQGFFYNSEKTEEKKDEPSKIRTDIDKEIPKDKSETEDID